MHIMGCFFILGKVQYCKFTTLIESIPPVSSYRFKYDVTPKCIKLLCNFIIVRFNKCFLKLAIFGRNVMKEIKYPLPYIQYP